MKWISRLTLFILGILLMVQHPINTAGVVAFVSALAAGCFAGYFRARWFPVLIAAIWTVLSLLFPVFCVFWPLLLYDAVLERLYPFCALPVICLAASGMAGSLEGRIALFGIALAIIVALYNRKIETLEKDMRAVRDDAAESNLALNRKNRDLVASQDYEIRIATLTERGRIAREIHDNVGHMLSRAMLQTGALIATVGDERVGRQLADLKETLTDAMNSVRASVHDLRDEAFDLRGLIDGCIRDFSAYACNVNVDLSNEAPNGVKYCFAAVIREAFANVERHSDATRIKIDLQEHPAFYKLAFEDNGTPQKQAGLLQSGMGLDNMRERTEALGGRFRLRTDKGFAIHIIIPKVSDE